MLATCRNAALFTFAAIAVGCAASSDKVAGPTLQSAGTATANARKVDAVTGHANIFLTAFQAEERYSNNALKEADGTVKGNFTLQSEQDGGIRIHGSITCFTVVGNRARLAGLIEQSDTPGFEGTYAFWTVVDNGEGANDPPDQTSDFFGPATAAQAAFHCNVGFILPLMPVLGGNLQVH